MTRGVSMMITLQGKKITSKFTDSMTWPTYKQLNFLYHDKQLQF